MAGHRVSNQAAKRCRLLMGEVASRLVEQARAAVPAHRGASVAHQPQGTDHDIIYHATRLGNVGLMRMGLHGVTG